MAWRWLLRCVQHLWHVLTEVGKLHSTLLSFKDYMLTGKGHFFLEFYHQADAVLSQPVSHTTSRGNVLFGRLEKYMSMLGYSLADKTYLMPVVLEKKRCSHVHWVGSTLSMHVWTPPCGLLPVLPWVLG